MKWLVTWLVVEGICGGGSASGIDNYGRQAALSATINSVCVYEEVTRDTRMRQFASKDEALAFIKRGQELSQPMSTLSDFVLYEVVE